MATGLQLRDIAVSKRGYRYQVGPTRTTGVDGYFDCSGLTTYAMRQCGIQNVPTVSWTQALWCHAAHTDGVALSAAWHIPGMLVFKGQNSGFAGFGPQGHVAITMGDGVNVIEAKGHAWGVLVDNQANNSPGDPWTNAAYVPGISYANSVPQVMKVHPDFAAQFNVVSIVQFHHPKLGTSSAMLTSDGAVYCYPRSAYLGGVNGKAYFKGRQAAAIRATENGYVIWDTAGERYGPHF